MSEQIVMLKQEPVVQNERQASNVCACGCTVANHKLTEIGKLACKNHPNCGNYGRRKRLTVEEVAFCGFNMSEY
jgi:hypothetical protein